MSQQDALERYDYIVVGGGTAGAIVARRLAENPLVTVCLIEAGPSDEENPVIADPLAWEELVGSKYDWNYMVEPEGGRGNPKMLHSRARLLGGCSSHNSVIAFIAPDHDLRRWEREGAIGWSPAATAPFFDKVLEKVRLERVLPVNELNCTFIAAAKEAGFKETVYNTKESLQNFGDSVGFFHLNSIGRERCSSSKCYLHPIKDLPSNLKLILNTVVIRILFDENKNAIAVQTHDGKIIGANKEIILCAGAFDSPKLLLLSGVGPKWHLREMGIPCVTHLPGVGEHLIDHPEGVIIWESTKPIPGPTIQKYEVGLFATVLDEAKRGYEGPDLMYHFALEAFDLNTKLWGYPTCKNAFSMTPNVTRAKSEGSVRLRSSNWQDKPRINTGYFTDKDGHDEEVMINAIKLARKLMTMPSIKEWVKRELVPGPEVQSDKDISEYVRKTCNSVYHPAGTCKMGQPSDPYAVVSPDLKVYGVNRLRVADASIFPSMPTINPCITIMMIGERCAAFIKAESQAACRL